VEAPARGQPALPALGAAQLLDGLLDERAVGGATLLALGLAECAWASRVLLSVGGLSPARVAPGGWRSGDGVDELVELLALSDHAGQPACWECST
jgi:hypothetical protein